MLIERFAVLGFKNLTAEVELTDLGAVNVIHGDNGVGKSNLLEAMTYLFRGLARTPQVVPGGGGWSAPQDWDDLGVDAHKEIFTLGKTDPVQLRLSLRLTQSDSEELDLGDGGSLAEYLWVAAAIKQTKDGSKMSLGAWHVPYGEDSVLTNIVDPALSHKVFAFIGRSLSSTHDTPRRRFEMVNVLRQTLGDAPVSGRHLVPAELLLALYDARESVDKKVYQRWELFKDTLATLSDVLGPGEIVPLYDRASGKANLALQRPEGRLPVHLLGSGAQQLIALIGRLALTDADFIGVEEPELNLRYTHQLRLRDVFQRLTQDPRGPRQIFITSHSPAFETGEHFYAMTMGPDGPQITRSPSVEAARFTQQDLVIPPIAGQAPLSYLTSEGLLQVPADVRERLGLPGGGGVVLVDSGPGAVEMMSNETWLARVGLGEDDEERPDDGG